MEPHASNNPIDSILAVAATHGIDGLELEWRLGQYGPRGFQPGLPESAWTKLVAALAASGMPRTDSKVTERDISGTKLVTPHGSPESWWKHKTRHYHFDAPPFLRIAAATESVQPIPPGSPLPSNGFTRYKERSSFRTACWSIDLTKVASTADIDCDTFTYEVEIELVDTDELFVRPIESVVEWGTQLAKDMMVLAGLNA